MNKIDALKHSGNRILEEYAKGSTYALVVILNNETSKERLAVIENIVNTYVDVIETVNPRVFEVVNHIPTRLSIKLFEIAESLDKNFKKQIMVRWEQDYLDQLEKIGK